MYWFYFFDMFEKYSAESAGIPETVGNAQKNCGKNYLFPSSQKFYFSFCKVKNFWIFSKPSKIWGERKMLWEHYKKMRFNTFFSPMDYTTNVQLEILVFEHFLFLLTIIIDSELNQFFFVSQIIFFFFWRPQKQICLKITLFVCKNRIPHKRKWQ